MACINAPTAAAGLLLLGFGPLSPGRDLFGFGVLFEIDPAAGPLLVVPMSSDPIGLGGLRLGVPVPGEFARPRVHDPTLTITMLRSAFVLAALLAALAPAQQVVYVKADASGNDDGSSWADAHVDLQDALAAANVGDEIWVAAGTYLPTQTGDSGAAFALRSGIALYGGFAGTETQRWQRDVAANRTILSGDLAGDDVQGTGLNWYASANNYGENSSRVVHAENVDATARLDGFTIRHGWAARTTSNPPRTGGGGLGIVNASPTIVDCTLHQCIGLWGGAVTVAGGSPGFTRCAFVETIVSDGRGGALALAGAQATLTDCRFESNTSRSGQQGVGGAVYLATDASAAFVGCRFVGNLSKNFYALGQSWPAIGGAVFVGGDGTTFERCAFVDNDANAGGGIFSYRPITVRSCVFNDNDVVAYNGSGGISMGGYGGGLAMLGTATATVVNTTFVNGTATDDGGGAFFWTAGSTVSTCVFRGNRDSKGDIGRSQCRGANPVYSCVENLLVGEAGEDPPDPRDYPGSIDLPPQFVDADGADGITGNEDDDLRLLPTSPCIDRGATDQPTAGLDLGGTPRALDGDLDGGQRLDMGAAEYSLAHVQVDVARTATTARITIDVSGAAGAFAFLLVGAPGPELQLPPFGGLFFDPATIGVHSVGTIPTTLVVGTPRTGAIGRVQVLALQPSLLGTFSNPVDVRL